MANTVRILITAKDEISSSLDKIKDKATLLSKTDIGKGMLQGAGIAGFNALKGAALGALDAVVDFGRGSIQAAADEERGIASLNASLKANVKGWESQTAAIERGIKAGERMGFSDDAVRASLAKLVGATHDVGQAFEIMATAQDLARFKGVSLEDASQALIKVEAGQYRALKELGIVLKEGATATEALAEVQKVAGGQAAAYTEQLAGKTEILANRMDNLQETVGGAVIPALDVATTALLGLGDAMDAAGTGTQEAQDGVMSFMDSVVAASPQWKGFRDQMAAANEEITASRDAANTAARAYDTGSEALAGYREPAAIAARKSEALAEANKRAATTFAKIRDRAEEAKTRLRDIVDAADDARDALLGTGKTPKELEISLDLAKLKGKDLKDELADLEKKKPTRQVREDIKETQLAIMDNQREVATLEGDLVRLGKVSLSKHAGTVEDLARDWGIAEQEVRDYLRTLSRVPGVKVPSRAGGNNRNALIPSAAGGPRAPYSTLLVGEHNAEVVRLGAIGAQVRPSVAGTGGAAPVVNINVSTPVMTPGAAQAMADAIAPHITRWQQARGL